MGVIQKSTKRICCYCNRHSLRAAAFELDMFVRRGAYMALPALGDHVKNAAAMLHVAPLAPFARIRNWIGRRLYGACLFCGKH